MLSSFEEGNYEQALIETFVKFDELLKLEKINDFLRRELSLRKDSLNFDNVFQKEKKEENKLTKDLETYKKSNESLIFTIDDDAIKKNKDALIQKNKELKAIKKDSLCLDKDDLKNELDNIKSNNSEKSDDLSSNTQNQEIQQEILESLNIEYEENVNELENQKENLEDYGKLIKNKIS